MKFVLGAQKILNLQQKIFSRESYDIIFITKNEAFILYTKKSIMFRKQEMSYDTEKLHVKTIPKCDNL